MSYIKTLSILLLVSANTIDAQTIMITVKDSADNRVPYVNIYASQSNFGEVTDSNGRAEIDLNKISSSDTILFSCIGYETYKISRRELANAKNIILSSKYYQVDPINILGSKVAFKKIQIRNE